MEREVPHTDIADRHQGGCFPAPPLTYMSLQDRLKLQQQKTRRYFIWGVWPETKEIEQKEEIDRWTKEDLEANKVFLSNQKKYLGTWDSARYTRELNQRVNRELNKKVWL